MLNISKTPLVNCSRVHSICPLVIVEGQIISHCFIILSFIYLCIIILLKDKL